MYSMFWVAEVMGLVENLNSFGSVILTKPILLADNTLETIGNLCWFSMPVAIAFKAFAQTQLFLKITYLLGTLPFVLTSAVIDKLGFKSLYVIKVLIMFAVLMCLMKYLINTTDLYKKVLKEKDNNGINAD